MIPFSISPKAPPWLALPGSLETALATVSKASPSWIRSADRLGLGKDRLGRRVVRIRRDGQQKVPDLAPLGLTEAGLIGLVEPAQVLVSPTAFFAARPATSRTR